MLVDIQKRDPEGRNLVVICLLFASYDVLEAIYQLYDDAGQEWKVKFSQFVLKQTFDYNPALILALSLAQFEQYRDRSFKTTKFLIYLIRGCI